MMHQHYYCGDQYNFAVAALVVGQTRRGKNVDVAAKMNTANWKIPQMRKTLMTVGMVDAVRKKITDVAGRVSRGPGSPACR